MQAISIAATGVSITTSGVSAGTTIPNSAAGTSPIAVRIASTQAAYVRIGTGAQTATTTDLLVYPGDSVIIMVGRTTHIAALQVATPGIVQVSPLEGL